MQLVAQSAWCSGACGDLWPCPCRCRTRTTCNGVATRLALPYGLLTNTPYPYVVLSTDLGVNGSTCVRSVYCAGYSVKVKYRPPHPTELHEQNHTK
jgi:hypothetical protein